MTKLEKEILYQEYDQLLELAHEAGQKALEAHETTMYKWSAETVPLGEEYDWENKGYEVHGNCGVAWVATKERGNGTFVKYLKAKYGEDRITKDCYRKDWSVPTDKMNMNVKGPNGEIYNDQEVEPKYAYCQAYAEVLNEFGLKATAWEYLT